MGNFSGKDRIRSIHVPYNTGSNLSTYQLLECFYHILADMTAKKFMIGSSSSVYHESSSPDSSYEMEMSLLGLKMESEDQENVDEDDEDEEEDECEDDLADKLEVKKPEDIKCEDNISFLNMVNHRHANRKYDGLSNGSGSKKKRYSRARSSRARSPTQVT